MARTHGSRLDALEQTAMRFILKSEMLERENDELRRKVETLTDSLSAAMEQLRTIERIKARLERIEAGRTIPIISFKDVATAQ